MCSRETSAPDPPRIRLTGASGTRVAIRQVMSTSELLASQLDRLAEFDPGPFPVVSLYLNMQPDQHGREHFDPFLRQELPARTHTYPAGTPERASLEQDAERIAAY